jgi:Undecaprenyl-phosphate galactose phosphotransferase WbaP
MDNPNHKDSQFDAETNPRHARHSLFTRWLVNVICFAAGDALAIASAFQLAGLVRFEVLGGTKMLPEWSWYITGLWIVLSSGVKLNPGWGMGVVETTRRMTLLLVTIFAGTATALFLAKLTDVTSRFTITLAFILALALLPLFRWGVKRALIHFGLWGMLVVIYGKKDKIPGLLSVLREGSGMGYLPVGLFAEEAPVETNQIDGVPLLPPDSGPAAFAHAAILLEPDTLPHGGPEYVESASFLYRRVLIVPELREHASSLWVTPRDLGGVLGMEISSNLQDGWSRLLKFSSEVLIVLVLLPFALTLIALISLLVFLWDRHSPFFAQTRIGLKGHPFRMWKFRTMHIEAESLLQKRLQEDEAFRTDWEKGCKVKKDPRITGIGRFLRATSLDELPQFLNVLRGEMALIGPRPLPEYHEKELPQHTRDLRQKVRPGMTGLWQVSGRSELGNEGFIRWDAYYVRNWSIWLDLVILVRTLRAVLLKHGAY